MNSETTRQLVLAWIEDIEYLQAAQNEVDEQYRVVCNLYYTEMDRLFKYRNVNPNAKRRLRHSLKPFWNGDLQNLWTKLCEVESSHLISPQKSNERNNLHNAFKDVQSQYDHMYMRENRRYERQKRTDIEYLNTDDSKVFWKEINKLGPRVSQLILMSVYRTDGNVTSDIKDVLDGCKDGLKTLLASGIQDGNFDDEFINMLWVECYCWNTNL